MKRIAAEKKEKNFFQQIMPNFTVSFLMLIVASLFTCYLLPKLNRYSQIQELRLKKCIEIIENDSEMDRRFNNILTYVEFFQKDMATTDFDLKDFKEKQKELREIFVQKYLEFEKAAFWWFGKIYNEAIVFDIASLEELKRIAEIQKVYDANIIQSTSIIEVLRHRYLSIGYKPDDSKNEELMKSNRDKFHKLRGERQLLIGELIQMLSKK